jgi:hypothetical protein
VLIGGDKGEQGGGEAFHAATVDHRAAPGKAPQRGRFVRGVGDRKNSAGSTSSTVQVG